MSRRRPFRRFWVASFLVFIQNAFPVAPAVASEAGCAVLLHGLGRTAGSMEKMAEALNDAGYRTVNRGYPSSALPIAELVAGPVHDAVQMCRDGERPVHFVTHSLGGILVRAYLQEHSVPPGSRAVMLAPPNQGSEVPDKLGDFPPFEWATGPAGQQLGTEPDSLPNRLGPVALQVGVIAGNRSYDPWFSWMLPGEDDGKVAVAKTRLAQMQDFLVVPAGHTFIMRSDEVIRQTLYFLHAGRFDHAPGEAWVPHGETASGDS